jgi:hypothetical protein
LQLDHLQHTPLDCFIPSLRALLERFNGVDRLLPPEQAPGCELLAAIELALREPTPQHSIVTMRRQITSLTALSLAVGATDSAETWDPIEEAFLAFERRSGGVSAWICDGIHADRFRLWLDDQLIGEISVVDQSIPPTDRL